MNLRPSTKILPSSLSIPKIVILFSQILQFFSPRLTVLFITKLFITPLSFRTPKREEGMKESAQKKNIFVSSIQKDIHILSYGYSKKKILLAHGWSGRSTQLFMIANKLLEKGYMVISFDGPAHGKSSGKTTNMVEYIETIIAINKEFGPFEAAIGHSFGAMSLLNVASNSKIFNCLVTIGSGDKVSEILSNFTHNLGLKQMMSLKMSTYFEKKWNIQLIKYAGSEAAKKIQIPTLVVHDVLDGDVAVSCAINIRQSLQKGSIFITNGLGHTKILRNQNVTNKIVHFITQNT